MNAGEPNTHSVRSLFLSDIHVGTRACHAEQLLSLARRKLGVAGHWSLADYAKRNVLRAVSFISNFEESVVRGVRERGLDGVICGHIHTPAIKRIDGLTYINCGDWVDSCTAVVEHHDGCMQLVRWAHPATSALPRAKAIAEAPLA